MRDPSTWSDLCFLRPYVYWITSAGIMCDTWLPDVNNREIFCRIQTEVGRKGYWIRVFHIKLQTEGLRLCFFFCFFSPLYMRSPVWFKRNTTTFSRLVTFLEITLWFCSVIREGFSQALKQLTFIDVRVFLSQHQQRACPCQPFTFSQERRNVSRASCEVGAPRCCCWSGVM